MKKIKQQYLVMSYKNYVQRWHVYVCVLVAWMWLYVCVCVCISVVTDVYLCVWEWVIIAKTY